MKIQPWEKMASMDWESYRRIAHDGLWANNQALVALLGLCPLLAVTSSAINSLALGLATTLTLLLSNGVISLLRGYLLAEIRLPIFVMLIASIVTMVDLFSHAFFPELHRTLGIFVPLIVTNCAILGRAELFASKQALDRSLADALFVGLGFTLALLALGVFREILGTGSLWARAELLFGDAAKTWRMDFFSNYPGFLLAVLPPGAFIGLGLLIALKNLFDDGNPA